MTSTDHAHVEQVLTAARHYDLDPPLICAMVEQESAWDTWAIRYEPAFFRRYLQPLIVAGDLKAGTESIARSFSFGLMQVMGQTAREFGFSGRWLTQLCDPVIGLDIGCKVFRAKLDRADGNRRGGLLAYNGGGDPLYPDKVLARLEKYMEVLP